MRWVYSLLILFPLLAAPLHAQSPTLQTYTLTAEIAAQPQNMTVIISRDGARERTESGRPGNRSKTLYDFAAHKVYWIDWFGQGNCSAGRYLSARAPAGEDFITGTADFLAKLPPGSTRKVVGSEKVNGIPARVEQIDNSAQPTPGMPTKIWLAEQGGFIVKIEVHGGSGRPETLYEVKQFSLSSPPPALLAPPPNCPMTDSEMDDTGQMRAHGELHASVKADATEDFAGETGHSTVTVTSTGGNTPSPATTPKVTTVAVKLAELPHTSPCGHKLQITGTISTDAPATIWYRVYSNVGGVDFSGGQNGTVTIEAAGSATLVKDATFAQSKQGEMRIQAAVQGPDGRHGSVTISTPVQFQVACAGPGAAPGSR